MADQLTARPYGSEEIPVTPGETLLTLAVLNRLPTNVPFEFGSETESGKLWVTGDLQETIEEKYEDDYKIYIQGAFLHVCKVLQVLAVLGLGVEDPKSLLTTTFATKEMNPFETEVVFYYFTVIKIPFRPIETLDPQAFAESVDEFYGSITDRTNQNMVRRLTCAINQDVASVVTRASIITSVTYAPPEFDFPLVLDRDIYDEIMTLSGDGGISLESRTSMLILASGSGKTLEQYQKARYTAFVVTLSLYTDKFEVPEDFQLQDIARELDIGRWSVLTKQESQNYILLCRFWDEKLVNRDTKLSPLFTRLVKS